jgi:signal transduction histidine kinase
MPLPLRPEWAETPDQLRARIARDLHEDLGARLLNQLHGATDDQTAASSRNMLDDVRALLDTLDTRACTLEECLNEWRSALTERLQDTTVHLRFPDGGDWPGLWLTTLERANPRRILMEFADNALRHAHPTELQVSFALQLPLITLRISHDGHDSAVSGWHAARGLRNQALRAQDLQAELSYDETDDRLTMTLRFALTHAFGVAHAPRTDR